MMIYAYIIAGVLGYVSVTTIVFFCFPTLVQKKKIVQFRGRHISHRGGAGENLENTMAAFDHAMAVGTDMLEIDVNLTRDGVVVISHDDDLARTTGHDGYISQTNFKDLPELKPSQTVTFSNGICIHTDHDDRHIPALETLFQHYPDTPVNIDIKLNSDELIRKVSDLVVKYKREGITPWGNKDKTIVNKCYKENSHMPLLFSARRVFTVIVLFYTGLLPFIPLRESFHEVPMPSVLLRHEALSWKAKLIIIIMDVVMMRPALFRHLEKRGIPTFLWVLNDEEDFERAFKLGVAGVMTDYPTRLKHFINTHPQLFPESH